MTWYWEAGPNWQYVDVYDHTGSKFLRVQNNKAPDSALGPRGVPTVPDVRREVVQELLSRGQADVYALRAIAEALTGADFQQGTP